MRDCWIAILALLIYEVRAPRREGPNTLASVCVCVLKPKTRGGRDPVTQAGGSREARQGRAAAARRWDGLKLHKLHVWGKETELALGTALLPGASGEGGPGRPEGTGAVEWDTIPAARQWPSNHSSATRVSWTQSSALEGGLNP